MATRKEFLIKSSLAVGAGVLGLSSSAQGGNQASTTAPFRAGGGRLPLAIATWNNLGATNGAWQVFLKGGTALDAVEAGVRVPEADPENQSVGFGGLPDRDGHVTLDACIMDKDGRAGSVCFLENIMHPISVARRVMEKTPHVMMSGEGAFKFAIDNGFKKENLLTEKSKKAWEEWKKESRYAPIVNFENHDTIGMLALDKDNNIAGACTTSGLAYKMHGRVGDSPIIGAGMFCDNEVGGACATGVGELVMKTLGSFLIVELMRQGRTPQMACEEAIHRIVKKQDYQKSQVGFLAVNKNGDIGSYSLQKGFTYTLYANNENKVFDSDYFSKR
ncbi:MAG: N(4)-(beta-N-acetylglucosaminyl)-L-asparaginase [Bacteroidetes bacterium]|nr:N(4)-(beta-N-acetylglucosaminyl)-L-asparaginase [Bacteroidota bacterium]